MSVWGWENGEGRNIGRKGMNNFGVQLLEVSVLEVGVVGTW